MKNLILGALLCSLFLFSCQSGTSERTGHEVHDHSHEGHDHAHDDHEGHDHEGHDHAHDEHVLEDGQVELSAQQFAQLGLEVETINLTPFYQIIKTAGQLEAATGQEAVISARSNGIVTYSKRNLTPGATMGKGEVLAYISDRNIADGEVLSRQRLALSLAEQEYERARQLMQDSLISVTAYNQAKAALEQARIALRTLASDASEQGVAISSPMAGFLHTLLVQKGAYVQAGDAIATVSTQQKMRVRADLAERYASQLPLIRSANIKTSDGQGVYELASLNGRLLSYARSVDPETQRLPVYFEIDHVGPLVAGSFVEVYLKTNEVQALTLPLSALIEEQGNYALYIQEAPGLYRKKAIKIGANDGARVVILAGLEIGQTVVSKGAYYLKLASMSSAIPHGHAH